MLTHWQILRQVMGINKPKLRRYGGYWQCEVEKDGVTSSAYGETPLEAWQMWGFCRLGLAPPRLLKKRLDNSSPAVA